MAASPVNHESLIVPASDNSKCDVLLAMVQAIAVLKADLNYRVDPDAAAGENSPTSEFAAHLGAIILPPGTIMPFALSTGSASNAELQAAVEALWSPGDGDPWWLLCDGENNTPDLRGRFIRGAGTNAESESYTEGVEAGANSVTLSIDNIPDHTHKLGIYSPTSEYANDMMFPKIAEEAVSAYEVRFLHTESSGAESPPATYGKVNIATLGKHEEIVPAEGDELEAVPSVPPCVNLVYAMRSTRMI